VPGSIHLDLAPRSCNDRELGCERINAQIVAPFQLDMLDGEGNILDALFAAVPFGNAICPLTAMKNAGLLSKCLLHARGPSCVTSWATVAVNARTSSWIAAERAGVSDCNSLDPV